MIKYSLRCEAGHEFEGWFRSSATYDEQAGQGQLTCPHCGTGRVEKAIMAPSVATRSSAASASAGPPAELAPPQVFELLRRLSNEVRARGEYVGPRFAEEARKIHSDESPARGIYGEASRAEVEALAEDGIAVCPLLPALDEMN